MAQLTIEERLAQETATMLARATNKAWRKARVTSLVASTIDRARARIEAAPVLVSEGLVTPESAEPKPTNGNGASKPNGKALTVEVTQ